MCYESAWARFTNIALRNFYSMIGPDRVEKMLINPWDRRQSYDLDYFTSGGIERRRGSWERRSGIDRRSSGDRRLSGGFDYPGHEKRSGEERRREKDRRQSLAEFRLFM